MRMLLLALSLVLSVSGVCLADTHSAKAQNEADIAMYLGLIAGAPTDPHLNFQMWEELLRRKLSALGRSLESVGTSEKALVRARLAHDRLAVSHICVEAELEAYRQELMKSVARSRAPTAPLRAR
ncbi:MAG: hypothetical protein A2542_03940 [Parcubacteria group bacterium RIFOXYD2_FULL_52_8]|nr:MAG: hypothetical protein A2542_03940 [Parcubacteria group bacterium RIFOXYD2_FULL_52_8]